MEELIIVNDKEKKTITIEGICYSYELFRSWGKDGFPIGTLFEITGREQGVISIKRIVEI